MKYTNTVKNVKNIWHNIFIGRSQYQYMLSAARHKRAITWRAHFATAELLSGTKRQFEAAGGLSADTMRASFS